MSAAIAAASRGIDGACERRFYPDADALQVRYYSPESYKRLEIEDLITLTSVTVDRTGAGSFTETWVENTDFVLEPLDAALDSQNITPWERLRVRAYSGRWLPCGIERSVKVTGKFGWTVAPDPVIQATTILASKLMKRARDAPFGVLAIGGEMGGAIRIARNDPDVMALIQPYTRTRPLL